MHQTTSKRDYAAVHRNDDALKAFFEKINKDKGWDFRNYKKSSMERCISRRLSAYNISSYEDYYGMLQLYPDEYNKLFSTLTIKVSEFFRERKVFELLREVIPARLDGAAEIRAWCCGCANGEEAYSLAMLLSECLTGNLSRCFKIYATDIDAASLDIARNAYYTEEKIKNVGDEMKARYFVATLLGYRIKDDIRDKIKFGRLDIVKDFPLPKMDIILCRNLFIYFEKNLQEEAFNKLDFALKPGGILVLGRAELPPALFESNYMEIKERSRVFIKKKVRCHEVSEKLPP